jgi:hypothetical protein
MWIHLPVKGIETAAPQAAYASCASILMEISGVAELDPVERFQASSAAVTGSVIYHRKPHVSLKGKARPRNRAFVGKALSGQKYQTNC